MKDAGCDVIGFVGTGAITAALVRGLLADPPHPCRIVVSPRNAAIAAELKRQFPAITVAAGNQEVVDLASIVFLAVRPQIADEVVPALRFRDGQVVVSIMAATSREQLGGWIDAKVDLVQAIPLPFVERREGVTALYPPHPRIRALFDRLGTAVECQTVQDYDLLAAASATMSLYFGLMGRTVDWLAARGLPEESGRAYLSALFRSLAHVAAGHPGRSLHAIAADHATEGGLNEQVWMDFDRDGGTESLHKSLDRVFRRIAPEIPRPPDPLPAAAGQT